MFFIPESWQGDRKHTICWIKSSDQTITDHQEFFSSDVNPVLICEFLSHGLFDANVFNVISIVMSKNPS